MSGRDLILTKNSDLTHPYPELGPDVRILVGVDIRYVEKPLSAAMKKLYPTGIRFELLPFEHPCLELNHKLASHGQEIINTLYQYIIDNKYIRLGQLMDSLSISKSAAKEMITVLMEVGAIRPMSTFYKIQDGWVDKLHQYLDPERPV